MHRSTSTAVSLGRFCKRTSAEKVRERGERVRERGSRRLYPLHRGGGGRKESWERVGRDTGVSSRLVELDWQ